MLDTEYTDLLIIGAGPAGLNAAIQARKAGVKNVIVLDEGPKPGGQIYRRFGEGFEITNPKAAGHEYTDGEKLIDEAVASGADIRNGVTVWGIWGKRVSWVSADGQSGSCEGRCLVVAPGARDRPIAFPGWTKPGVITAGAAKILVSLQRVLPGKRILMAGSGPLALAFSAQLLDYGANIVSVSEAAPRPSIANAVRLVRSGEFSLLWEGAKFFSRLRRAGVPFEFGTIITRVDGDREVESATLASVDADWRVIPGTERQIKVDTVLLGYGLETASELFRLIGCKMTYDRALGGWIPDKDDNMRTSLSGIYAIGDGSGVGGSRFAIQEGKIAGIYAAQELGAITPQQASNQSSVFRKRLRRLDKFRTALNEAYRPGQGANELAKEDTIICRCEEKRQADLEQVLAEGVTDMNVVRAQTRIGMGRCQGRNCASHVAAAIAAHTGTPVEDVPIVSARAPVRPVNLSVIAAQRDQPEHEISEC